MTIKRELVIHSDLGLVGTFVKWIRKSQERNYVYLQYVPLNSFPPKKQVLEKAINIDHIHMIHSQHNDIPGVEDRMVFIHTGEPGSILANVLKSDSEQTIAELREKIRKLQMQVASSKQSEEDARSGVNKAISSMKAVQRPVSSPTFDNPQRYPPTNQDPYNNYGNSGFEDF